MQKCLQTAPEEIPQAFTHSFNQCNSELGSTSFDVSLSGTTCCTLLFNGTRIYCGNAGDSRAIKVGFSSPNGPLDVQALNIDHKPDLPEESERIKKKGGRIDAFRDYYNNGEPIGP